mgnify:CR=1 FL=1
MSSSPEADGCPVFWFSGLSGAGKTTVAEAVSADLKSRGLTVVIFDGDDVRRNRKSPLGFSRRHVLINNAEMAALCRAGRGRADAILVPIISPYRLGRARARAVIGHGFHEIYFSADQQCVAARDAKGLYAQAARGPIPPMIGFSHASPYAPPPTPDPWRPNHLSACGQRECRPVSGQHWS